MLLGEDHLFLGLYARGNWEQTRIHTSSGPFPPYPSHRVVTVKMGRDGWGGKHNSSKSKNSHLVTDRVTSLIEGLITAQSKAVLELI